MWRPHTELEIQEAAAQAGGIVESETLDVKRELGKSMDIAIDVAAMASAGGVLIYGVAEDQDGNPTQLAPIQLKNTAERVDQVVQSGISEPPHYHAYSIPTEADASVGYLVLVVPASERAPHMVTVKNENRYYRRGSKRNVPMTEAEVALLYERRQRLQHEIEESIKRELHTTPPDMPLDLYMTFAIRPVGAGESLLADAAAPAPGVQIVQSALREAGAWALPGELAFDQMFTDPKLEIFWQSTSWKRDYDGYVARADVPPLGTIELFASDNGLIRLFSSRVGAYNNDLDQRFVFHKVIAAYICRLGRIAGLTYGRAQYFGTVAAGIRVGGTLGSIAYRGTHWGGFVHPSWVQEKDEYQRIRRLSVGVLLDDWKVLGEALVDPFLDALTQGQYRPFKR